jgi:hypothetical protein
MFPDRKPAGSPPIGPAFECGNSAACDEHSNQVSRLRTRRLFNIAHSRLPGEGRPKRTRRPPAFLL